MKNALILAALAFSTAAYANPAVWVVHLECETRSPNGTPGKTTITLDENAGTAVFTDALLGNGIRKVPAKFSQTHVLFQHTVTLGIPITFQYQLDRVAGTLVWFTDPSLQTTGTCTKATPVDRKF